MPIKKPPLKKNCFQCQKEILVKFCPPFKNYVQKNNWGYWTEREEYNDRYICSDCLKKLYYGDYEKFCKEVVAEKKKRIIKTYLSLDIL